MIQWTFPLFMKTYFTSHAGLNEPFCQFLISSVTYSSCLFCWFYHLVMVIARRAGKLSSLKKKNIPGSSQVTKTSKELKANWWPNTRMFPCLLIWVTSAVKSMIYSRAFNIFSMPMRKSIKGTLKKKLQNSIYCHWYLQVATTKLDGSEWHQTQISDKTRNNVSTDNILHDGINKFITSQESLSPKPFLLEFLSSWWHRINRRRIFSFLLRFAKLT